MELVEKTRSRVKLFGYHYLLGAHPLGRWAVVTVPHKWEHPEAEQPTLEEWERIKDVLGEERARERGLPNA